MIGFDPQDWPSVSALLDQALDLAPQARSAWLDALPAESARYRGALARLLAAEGGIETNALFDELPRIAIEAVAAGAETLAHGQRVGPYVLLQPIGRGGMGSVWLAERADALPRRKVALKLPHLGWSPELMARLDRERDILASLEHPHIARLYEAGVAEGGRPFLALEYVDGVPLDRHAADHALSVRERLGLLLQVADAVAYAHAHLVVHRDLKPSNILVTATGEVRLLDFGIAKLLDGDVAAETALTLATGRAMTLDYASPEQVRGDPLSTASDVYSLGVVAYELLTGARPYRLRRGTAAALEEAIVSAQVPAASSQPGTPAQKKALRGDLDAILGKALKKDLAERYPSVDAFALDVRRHLTNQPVAAQPDRWLYRARKFAARYRLQLGAVAVIVLALAVGLTTALTQAARANRERAAAVAAREASERSRVRAEKVASFMQGIFSAAALENGATVETRAVELLAHSRQRVASDLAGDADLQHETLMTIGESLFSLGDDRNAAETLELAFALDGRTPIHDRRRARVARAELAHVRALLGQGDAAERLLAPLLDGSGPRDEGLAIAQEVQSVLLVNRSEAEPAILSARQSVQTWDGITVEPGADSRGRFARQLLEARRRALLTLARAEFHADHNAEALVTIDRALRQLDAMAAGTVPAAVRALHVALRARILRDLGRLDDAAQTYQSVLPLVRSAFGPRSMQASIDLLEYGGIERKRGRYDEAIALFRESVDIAIENHASPRNLGTHRAALAGALKLAYRHNEAAAEFERSAADTAAGVDDNNPSLWAARAFAATEAAFGGSVDAHASLRTARQAFGHIDGLAPERINTIYRNEVAVQVAALAALCGEADMARQLLQSVPADAATQGTLAPLSAGIAEVTRGRLALTASDVAEARARFQAALAALPAAAADPLERSMALVGVARVDLIESRTAAALRAATDADTIAARRAPQTRWAAEARAWHGWALIAAGQATSGRNLLQQARAMFHGERLPGDRTWLHEPAQPH